MGFGPHVSRTFECFSQKKRKKKENNQLRAVIVAWVSTSFLEAVLVFVFTVLVLVLAIVDLITVLVLVPVPTAIVLLFAFLVNSPVRRINVYCLLE